MNYNNQSKKFLRDNTFDSIKGFGIILVCIGHASSYRHNFPYENITNFIYLFHMPLFFFISGLTFYIQSSNQNLISFSNIAKTKVHQIYYPYIVWSFIEGIIRFSLSKYIHMNNPISLKELMLIPFYPILHYWFLYALLLTTLVFSLFKNKINNIVHLLISILIIFIPYNLGIITKVFQNYFFFALGYTSFVYLKNNIHIIKRKSYFLLSFSLIVISYRYFFEIKILKLLVVPLSGIIFSYILALYFLNYINLFSRLGKISLEIYLTHILIAVAIRTILNKFFGVRDSLIIFLEVFLGIFIPYITIKYLKKETSFLFRMPN